MKSGANRTGFRSEEVKGSRFEAWRSVERGYRSDEEEADMDEIILFLNSTFTDLISLFYFLNFKMKTPISSICFTVSALFFYTFCILE